MVAPRITQAIVAKTKINRRAMILLTVDMVSLGFAAGEDTTMEQRSSPCQLKTREGSGTVSENLPRRGTETRRNGKELKARVAAEEPRKAQIKCQAFKNLP
jgi:hypothetical protein